MNRTLRRARRLAIVYGRIYAVSAVAMMIWAAINMGVMHAVTEWRDVLRAWGLT